MELGNYFEWIAMWNYVRRMVSAMTDPDLKELFPENPGDLKPWHPLMGFGWDAVRRAESHHFAGIPEVKSLQSLKEQE